MKSKAAVRNGTPFTVKKILPRAGLELATARSIGHRLTHWTTGAPQLVFEKLTKYLDSWERERETEVEEMFLHRCFSSKHASHTLHFHLISFLFFLFIYLFIYLFFCELKDKLPTWEKTTRKRCSVEQNTEIPLISRSVSETAKSFTFNFYPALFHLWTVLINAYCPHM